jgi:hypothetical protein
MGVKAATVKSAEFDPERVALEKVVKYLLLVVLSYRAKIETSAIRMRPGEEHMSATSGGSPRSQDEGAPPDGGPSEAASFIAEAVSDLSRMARRHGLDMLGFLLDMAQMEAEERVRRRDK